MEGECRSSVLALTDGRFVRRIEGALTTTEGCGIEHCWELDIAGTAKVLDLGRQHEVRASVWLETGLWALPTAPFDVEIVRDLPGKGEVILSVTLRDTGWSAEVVIDHDTWRPRSYATRDYGFTTTVFLEDYGAQEGLLVARTIRTVAHWQQQAVMPLSEMVVDAPFEEASFELPRDLPVGALFDSNLSPSVPCRQLEGHYLLAVDASLEGAEPGLWLFDTGASANAVDSSLAEQLKIDDLGSHMSGGTGGALEMRLRQGTSLQMGPLTIVDPIFLELDLSFLDSLFDTPIQGVIGHETLASAIFEIEPATPAIRVYAPETYRLATGEWETLLNCDDNACVHARFEGGREGPFRLDTGGDAVVFHHPAVQEFGLLEHRKTKKTKTFGVGGLSPAREGVIEYFEVGGHTFAPLPVSFSLAEVGSFADTNTVGNIGMNVLQPFVVVLDFTNRRIAFVE